MATSFSTSSSDVPTLQDSREGETAISLLRRLMDELAALFRKEVELATAEVSGALAKLATAVVSVLTGGMVLFAGILVLLASAVLALAQVVEPWLAALIVGGVVTLIGVVLILIGRRSIDPTLLKPRRSAESLRQDKDVIMRNPS
jgi:hypothetical protein